MRGFDARLFRAVNHFADRTSWAHGPVAAYATLGIGLFAILLIVGWWTARADRDLDALACLLWAGAGTLVAVGLNQVIGSVVGRARPYTTMPNVHVLISRTSDFSFPSDHAVAAGAAAAGLVLASRRLGAMAAVLALLMAAARVYVGAHYPGDVVAGLAMGAVVVVAGALVAVPLLRSVVGAVDRSRLRTIVAAEPAPEPVPTR
ncbi:MAG: phosphatase PAP2 family protein [Actinomycetota bacterium]|nr:phosphatase PAP2 family protein [Actinomycetota bacterium]